MEANKRIRSITITIEEETIGNKTFGHRGIVMEGGFSNCELVGILEVYKTQFGVAALRETCEESEVKPDEQSADTEQP